MNEFPFLGGYRVLLGVLAYLWVGALAALVVFSRKKRVVLPPVVVVVEPSLFERIRPLLEPAANGSLSAEGKAQLERLILGFWKEKLDLPEMGMVEALEQLKAHAQAGELLRAMERWLHQRAGASASEVNALIEVYRKATEPAPAAATDRGRSR